MSTQLNSSYKPMVQYKNNIDTCELHFQGVDVRVFIENADGLVPIIKDVFRGFTIDISQPVEVDTRQPFIHLAYMNNGHQRNSTWLDKPRFFTDPVDTVCDFSVDLIKAYLNDNAGALCLHCAAVKMGNNFVVFPSYYRSGKSTLTLQLASMGMKVFTDDALLLSRENNSGVALEILPRIRMPMPKDITSNLREFVLNRVSHHNRRYCYINLKDDELASYGEEATISHIVLLNREKGATPQLTQIPSSKVIRELILRNFAYNNPALRIVDRLTDVINNSNNYMLTYDNLEKAGEMLLANFSDN